MSTATKLKSSTTSRLREEARPNKLSVGASSASSSAMVNTSNVMAAGANDTFITGLEMLMVSTVLP